ncbi:MAG: alanine--tRNA ligase [Candidatus Cloacimonadaceae bacterium]
MISGKDIRQQFVDFFIKKGHTFVPSSPVIPNEDPTLLFTNAGMNQFKNIFLGLKDPAFPRAVNSQKCIRAGGKHNDLEEVGKDGYHHTFFEMLGNWSFGDYYKKEAIAWAWELLTDVWKLPKDKLYATVHHTDQEAFALWQSETDIEPTHISYHGDKDNFWEMGETGPCGPCSEIHIDRGADFCDKQHMQDHVCQVNGDCGRYIELWNLVFIQYNKDEQGKLNPLPNKYVDTGAGLDRICQVLQNQNSNYHTDLFLPIIDKIAAITGQPYAQDDGTSHRVIADHIRCLSFALADGGFPSNEGRGYVLRRILRRAARHGRLLNMHEPFLYKLVDSVIGIMGHHYHELKEKQHYIKSVIKAEEERFNQTLDTGLDKFNEIVSKLKDKKLSGIDAFMLYDTYGFPLDLTTILAEEQGLAVDTMGFEQEMAKQKQRAREAGNFKHSIQQISWTELSNQQDTKFVGYEQSSVKAQILRYSLDDDNNIVFQLDKTPFVAEAGGQVADTGKVFNDELSIVVSEVRKINDRIVHIGKLKFGIIENPVVTAEIDLEQRKRTARNHTATHLLHKALRTVLGEHVQQKGSLVAPDYLRFDFAHFEALSREQIQSVEKIVNQQIRANLPVSTSVKNIDEARREGAMALFGEKYSEQVRVVSVEGFSKELCGGTHVQATGDIGFFKITSESSSAAGIRRIEAITGDAAETWVLNLQDKLAQIAEKLNTPEKKLFERIDLMLRHQSELEKALEEHKHQAAREQSKSLSKQAISKNDFDLLVTKVEADSADELRKLGDELRETLPQTVSVLFAVFDGKVSINVNVSKELTGRFHAGKLAGQIAALVGGKGGGKPDSAMAGGKDIDKVDFAIQETLKLFA